MSLNPQLTTDDLIQMLESNRPPRHSGSDSSIAGMGHIIRILSEIGEPVTAGTLSRECGVSTARVAVLLRKLEEKGFIIRSEDPKDGRKTIVSLTEQGKSHSEKKNREFRAMLQEVIDTIGEERLQDYVKTTGEIRKIVKKDFLRSAQEDEQMFDCLKGENHL